MAANKKKAASKQDQPTLVEFMQQMLAEDPEKQREDWWTVDGSPEIAHLRNVGKYDISSAEERNAAWHEAEVAAAKAAEGEDGDGADDSASGGDGSNADSGAGASGDDGADAPGKTGDERGVAKRVAEQDAQRRAKGETEKNAALEKAKPWMKPDYTGPLTAVQAVERGRYLRQKGLRPDGRPMNAAKTK